MWAEVEVRGHMTHMAGLPDLVPGFQLQQDTIGSVYRAAAGLHASRGRRRGQVRFKFEKADLRAS